MKKVIEWIKPIVIALIIALLINSFILFNGFVPTSSMAPTIAVNDRVFAFRLSYIFSEPSRGDIIIFDSNHDNKRLVKRLIGLPGEIVEISDNLVFINGDVLEEPYLSVETLGDFGPYEVPENEYFMMGDNRNKSSDSRYWEDPYVSDDEIIGKVVLKYFPSIEYLGGKE